MSTEQIDTQAELKGLDAKSRKMVVDTVKMLKTRSLSKENILAFDKNEIFPEETIREMISPDIGLQLLFIPEEYGGVGGGTRDNIAMTRELAKICMGISTALLAIQLGADPIVFGATEAQKKKWLGRIAEGMSLVAYAVTEPDAGSNLAALTTTADPVKNDQGKLLGYTVNGTKQFISNGGYADFITLLAKTPEGPSFFIVEKGEKGFVQNKGEEKHGIRASNTSPLSFNDVFVPIENLIGDIPGQGMKLSNVVFGYTRLLVAAMAQGAGEAAMEIAIAYAKERIQFGTPLSEKQGYTHKLIVPNVVKLDAAATYIDEIATRLDAGESDLQTEGSIAKLFASESANKAADDAMQALGGYGYIAEYEVEKIKRDVKITCIYEGTSEIQQNIISTFRWKQTRKTKGAYYDNIVKEMERLEEECPDLGCRYYGLAASILNYGIDLVHENRLTREQTVMFGLADMMTHVEIGASVARKAVRQKKSKDPHAERTGLVSRIFANMVADCINYHLPKIVMGSGIFDNEATFKILASEPFQELLFSNRKLIQAKDRFADILFKR